MTHQGGAARQDRMLEDLADGLARDSDLAARNSPFAPEHETETPAALPGRKPGAHLTSVPAPVAGPGAVILDCGTSRHEHFTHVLLVSPAVREVLGREQTSRLGDALTAILGVTDFAWEGVDHLHVQAPGFEHADLLGTVRAVVVQLASQAKTS